MSFLELFRGRIMIAFVLFASISLCAQDNWPQYRGPNRDGHSGSTGMLKTWPENGPRLMWRVPIGEGFSAITVVDGLLYTGFAEAEKEFLGCYEADSGKELWRLAIGEIFNDEFGDGPRSAPTVDGELVFALGSKGELHAADRKTGKEVWMVSCSERFGSKVARWGYSMSPLVDGDRVIMEAGGGENNAIVALDRKTGKTIWSAYNGVVGYSSPVFATINGQPQYVFLVSKPGDQPQAPPKQFAVGLSREGQVLWEHPAPGFIVAMPLFVPPDRIFFSASNDDGARLLKLNQVDGKTQVEEVWHTQFMKNHFNSSVVSGDSIYGFSNATLTCLSLADGEKKWVKRGLGKGSLVLIDGRLLALSDKGRVVLFEATPEAYREVHAFQPFTAKSWTSPTVAGGKLFMRTQKEMAGYDLKN